MEERRKYKRYCIAYPIEGPPVEKSLKESLLDLSKNGISFIGKNDVQKDSVINIKVFLKNRMFRLKAAVVYVKKLKSGEYSIGAKFIDPPKEFIAMFDKEIDEIKHLHRESNLHKHKSSSFKRISREYLETLGMS